MKSSPQLWLRFNSDAAPMFGDYGMGRCEAQTAALFFGGKIGIEYPAKLLLGDAYSLVFYGCLDIATRQEWNIGGLIQDAILGADEDVPSLRHGMNGIDDQIIDHLIHLALISFNRPQVIGK
jgi:hypothetical protein